MPAAMAAASAAAAPPASATKMSGMLCPGTGAIGCSGSGAAARPADRSSGELRAPRIVAFERLIEVEDFAEFVSCVRRLAHQQLEIHEREDDVAEVRGGVHTPVIQHETRHDAEAVERQIAAGQRELTPADVTPLRQALLAKFQGAENEQIGALVESLLAQSDSMLGAQTKFATEGMRKINTRSFVRATRATPREVNRQILLNLVREHEPISRADLARRMEIARGMVTSLVDELIADGSLYEGATVDSPRGRRPQMLFVRTRGRLVIAIDVRFSRTYVMLGDFSGTAIALETFDTPETPETLVAEVCVRVRRLLETHRDVGTCEGLGLVVPGMVNNFTGRILNAPYLGWRNVDIRDTLAESVQLPVFVENAPIACALAQMWLGQRGGTDLTDFVYVTSPR